MNNFKFDLLRESMVDYLIKNNYIKDERLIYAFSRVPREKFVLKGFEEESYIDKPLFIGMNQTISRPSVIGYMIESAEIKKNDRVLEIGTGSGYQTALLSMMANEVFSIEYIPELGNSAIRSLRELGYNNVRIRIGDGRQGWYSYSPFDAIIVCASAENLIKTLIDQLSLNGRLIMPIENPEEQYIMKIVKKRHYIERLPLRSCAFVKLNNGDTISCSDF